MLNEWFPTLFSLEVDYYYFFIIDINEKMNIKFVLENLPFHSYVP
jgi:hypothetical protein